MKQHCYELDDRNENTDVRLKEATGNRFWSPRMCCVTIIISHSMPSIQISGLILQSTVHLLCQLGSKPLHQTRETAYFKGLESIIKDKD
jgi:hypothetical protein